MRTNRAKSIIATENEASASGVITYWSLTGSVSYTVLKTAWESMGITLPLLSPVSATVALKRAVDNVAPIGSLVKPLKDEDGYTVVRKVEEEGAVQKWCTAFSAYVDDRSGRLTVFARDDSGTLTYDEAKLAGEIEDHLELELDRLHSIDLSMWLVRLVERELRAVSLRDNGGFYFVPRGDAEQQWEQVAKALEKVNVQILTIPAMHSERAALAVLKALTDEIQANTASLQVALDAARMGTTCAEHEDRSVRKHAGEDRDVRRTPGRAAHLATGCGGYAAGEVRGGLGGGRCQGLGSLVVSSSLSSTETPSGWHVLGVRTFNGSS